MAKVTTPPQLQRALRLTPPSASRNFWRPTTHLTPSKSFATSNSAQNPTRSRCLPTTNTNRSNTHAQVCHRHPTRLQFHTTPVASMSDADYAAFLEKANQGTGGATTQESKQYGTKSVNTAVPKSLERVEAIYISETDAEFEPVALAYSGSSISAGELKKVLDHDADVTEIAVKDFDPRGQYTQVVESVKEAGSGEAKVFRVEHGSTRAELYVVSVDEKDGRIVGLKVLVVES